jgi:hypothetical protein
MAVDMGRGTKERNPSTITMIGGGNVRLATAAGLIGGGYMGAKGGTFRQKTTHPLYRAQPPCPDARFYSFLRWDPLDMGPVRRFFAI